MSPSTYLKPKDIAAYFGVTLATVRRWVKNGKLTAIETPGGAQPYHCQSILRYGAERKNQPVR